MKRIMLIMALSLLTALPCLAEVKNYPDGSVYDGEVKDGQRNGNGVQQWPDGGYYDGQFVNDVRQGQGVLRTAEGDFYAGTFANDQFNGQGKLKKADGQTYQGEFKDNVYQGQGTLVYEDGRFFSGNFNQGQPDGLVYFREESSPDEVVVKIGLFKGGKMVESWASPDNMIYQGGWKDKKRDGLGRLLRPPVAGSWDSFSPGQVVCEGQFIDDQAPDSCKQEASYSDEQEGPISATYPDGSSFKGTGNGESLEGVFTFADKSVYQGSMPLDEMGGRMFYGPVQVVTPSGETKCLLLEGGFPALLSDQQHQEACSIYQAAEKDLEQGRLTKPQGNCASEKSKRLFDLGAISAARHLQVSILQTYEALQQKSLEKGDKKAADRLMKEADTFAMAECVCEYIEEVPENACFGCQYY